MARLTSLTALVAITTLAAGCAQTKPEIAARHNPTLYSVHQPVVQRADYVLDLATGAGGLPSGETGRLRAWFDSLELGYGDRVYVDGPAAYADAAARSDVANVASQYGLLLEEGAPITAGQVSPGSVRVVVSRMSASVPGCPDWSYSALSGAPISTDSNYGCAINSNLAAMIADPNDLVLGQAGAADAATALKAVKQYREAVPTGTQGLKVESATGGGK